MTDAQFAELVAEDPDLFFEVTAEGELLMGPPAFTLASIRNREILGQLDGWARLDRSGIVCDSSGGFVLPNGARRSPDASWVPRVDIGRLEKESLEGYWHLCPAFAIELRSHSDRIRVLRGKMREYIENGARLGWLIDPETRSVEIYRPDREPEVLAGIESIAGEGPVAGFVLDLLPVWEPLV